MISRLSRINLDRHLAFFLFLRDFLKDPVAIGAISESSKAMARAMMEDLKINFGDPVMEFGPGTGVFTKKIREKTNIYLGIERNLRFTQLLDRRFPDMKFVNGLAEDGFSHYKATGLPPPKVIICGLPLAIWVDELQDAIIENLENLMTPGCVFRTFQYAHSFAFPLAIRFRHKMNLLCGQYERSPIVLRNLPPAFILTWQRVQT